MPERRPQRKDPARDRPKEMPGDQTQGAYSPAWAPRLWGAGSAAVHEQKRPLRAGACPDPPCSPLAKLPLPTCLRFLLTCLQNVQEQSCRDQGSQPSTQKATTNGHVTFLPMGPAAAQQPANAKDTRHTSPLRAGQEGPSITGSLPPPQGPAQPSVTHEHGGGCLASLLT